MNSVVVNVFSNVSIALNKPELEETSFCIFGCKQESGARIPLRQHRANKNTDCCTDTRCTLPHGQGERIHEVKIVPRILLPDHMLPTGRGRFRTHEVIDSRSVPFT